jgi:hypothetical protein
VLRTFVEIKVTEFQNGGKFPEAIFFNRFSRLRTGKFCAYRKVRA